MTMKHPRLLLFFLYDFLISLHFSSAVLIPFFSEWGGLSYTQIFFLQSWFMAWVFILEIPTGVFADRIGKKKTLLIATIIGALGLATYSMYPNYLIFLIAEFLLALSVALMSGTYDAFFYDYMSNEGIENKSKKFFGFSHSSRMTGLLITAPIGAYIAKIFGLNITLLFEAGALLIAFIVIASIPSVKLNTNKIQENSSWKIFKNGANFLRSHKEAKRIAIKMSAIGAAGYFVIWSYQIVLKTIGIPIEQYGWFYMLILVAEIIIAGNFTFLDKLFKSQKQFTLFVAFAVFGSFLLLAFNQSILTVLVFIVLAGGFGLTQEKYLTAHINQWIPGENRATVLSLISMMQRMFIIIINPIIGLIIDRSISTALFLVGIIFSAIFILPGIFIRVPRHENIVTK